MLSIGHKETLLAPYTAMISNDVLEFVGVSSGCLFVVECTLKGKLECVSLAVPRTLAAMLVISPALPPLSVPALHHSTEQELNATYKHPSRFSTVGLLWEA